MQIETQREASRPERSPEVFLLSAYTLRDDPEIKRGWEVSSDPPGAFPWPAIELWMREADLTALIVAVNFGGGAPTMAKWISERERSLWVDVLTPRPRTTDRAGWGLAVVRAGDAALRALTQTFGLSPIADSANCGGGRAGGDRLGTADGGTGVGGVAGEGEAGNEGEALGGTRGVPHRRVGFADGAVAGP